MKLSTKSLLSFCVMSVTYFGCVALACWIEQSAWPLIIILFVQPSFTSNNYKEELNDKSTNG